MFSVRLVDLDVKLSLENYYIACIQCVPLCDGLKRMGHLLESDHSEKLEMLQMYLTEICKDTRVDVTLRLKVLEIIELRSLGWNTNPGMESFYQEKISMFEKKENSSSMGKLASPSPPPSPVSRRGDGLASQSSLSSVDSQVAARSGQKGEYLSVSLEGENVRLFLSSASPRLTKHAKLILSQHFASKSSSGSSIGAGVQYTREDLLSMASSPTVREKPEDWDCVLANIPEIVRKP